MSAAESKNNRRKLRLLTDRMGEAALLEAFESFLLEMNSHKEIKLRGCREVLDFNVGEIKLDTGLFIVRITGAGLLLKTYSPESTTVAGDILQIDFISR